MSVSFLQQKAKVEGKPHRLVLGDAAGAEGCGGEAAAAAS